MSRKLETIVDFGAAKATGGARLVLKNLADEANDDGGQCFPSHARLAAKSNIDPRSVQRAVKQLAEYGYLKVLEPGTGRRSTRYQLFPDVIRADKTPTQEEVMAIMTARKASRDVKTSPLNSKTGDDKLSALTSQECHPCGDISVTSGVTPESPDPLLTSYKPQQQQTEIETDRDSAAVVVGEAEKEKPLGETVTNAVCEIWKDRPGRPDQAFIDDWLKSAPAKMDAAAIVSVVTGKMREMVNQRRSAPIQGWAYFSKAVKAALAAWQPPTASEQDRLARHNRLRRILQPVDSGATELRLFPDVTRRKIHQLWPDWDFDMIADRLEKAVQHHLAGPKAGRKWWRWDEAIEALQALEESEKRHEQ